jgi:Mce-associated membrane protein
VTRPSRARPVAGQRARARAAQGAGAEPTPTVADAAPTVAAAPAVVVGDPPETATADDAAAGPDERGTTTRAPAAAERTAQRRDRRLGRPGSALLVLLALTLAALVVLAVVAIKARGAEQVETARDQAQAAATDHVVDILSYDYRHLSRDFARGGAALTGRFKGDYAQTTSRVIRPTAEQYHAVVKAEVAGSSVVSATSERVVVLLFVNQTTTSTRLDGPKVDLNRVRLTLDKTGGQWLVSDVQAL